LQFSDERESEQALIQRARNDPDAFRTIFRAMHPRVFAYVAYRVGRAEDAEDITAEVFMRVVNGLGRFEYRGEGSFTAWLFQIAHREVARFFSRKRIDADIPMDELPDIAGYDPTPEQALVRKERFAAVRAALAELPPRRAEVLTLKFYGELRNKEIAAVLGLDERTVASNLSRALDQLEQTIRAEWPQLAGEDA
jgi:RNA polymerase sigma-70 factor (ECF subfamily)